MFYSENVINIKVIIEQQRVINNTLVLLIIMQLKINKTYVTTYKTVFYVFTFKIFLLEYKQLKVYRNF